MATVSNEPINLVLIEDDESHATLLKKNVKRSGLACQLFHELNGENGYNKAKGLVAKGHKPFVILDLNLPVLSGQEVLTKLKNNPETSSVPVLVFSSQLDPNVVNDCYIKGANLYISKPAEMSDYKGVMKLIEDLLKVAIFP
jgi:response regulator RpfG family c-di-GMP phosphodiesterase